MSQWHSKWVQGHFGGFQDFFLNLVDLRSFGGFHKRFVDVSGISQKFMNVLGGFSDLSESFQGRFRRLLAVSSGLMEFQGVSICSV